MPILALGFWPPFCEREALLLPVSFLASGCAFSADVAGGAHPTQETSRSSKEQNGGQNPRAKIGTVPARLSAR